MRALAVRQPWASLVATGDKSILVLPYRTDYRGPVVVVAALEWDPLGRKRVMANVPSDEADELFPTGVAQCLVDLVEVRRAGPADEARAWEPVPEGAFAWVVERPQELAAVECDLPPGELREADVELLSALGLLS
jgi:hypothetical protein